MFRFIVEENIDMIVWRGTSDNPLWQDTSMVPWGPETL